MDGDSPPLGCKHYVRLVASIIGVVAGLSACAVFPFTQNITASVFAFTSAIFAGVCLTLHILHHRQILSVWHSPDTLGDISKLGFCVFVISTALTVWFIFIGLYHHRAMMPMEENPYITAVWTFMTAKWGLFLWSSSRTYSKILDYMSI